VKRKTILIGLGEIGFGRSSLDLNSEFLNSHFLALYKNANVELMAVIDKDEKKLSEIKKNYQDLSEFQIAEKMEKIEKIEEAEIAVIATTTKSHLEVIEHLFRISSPKFIICEKPVGMNLFETLQISELCSGNGTTLIPFYNREFLNEYIDLANVIRNLPNCAFNYGTLMYGQGLLNNGCHFVRLILTLVKDMAEFKVSTESNSYSDSPSFSLHDLDKSRTLKVIGSPSQKFRLGDVRLEFGENLVEIKKGGSNIQVLNNSSDNAKWESDIFFERVNIRVDDFENVYSNLFTIIDENPEILSKHLELSIKTKAIIQKVFNGQ
jgi:predicted dehydrogenase